MPNAPKVLQAYNGALLKHRAKAEAEAENKSE